MKSCKRSAYPMCKRDVFSRSYDLSFMSIHPTAIVHPDAELSEGVEVQPFTIIGPYVSIGKGTVVGPHCVIEGRTRIGDGNRFYSGAQIGVRSQDLKHKDGLVGRVEIGNDNVFREHVSVSASTLSSEEDDHRVTSLGDNCLLMTCCHVAHDCHLGSDIVMANCATLAGHVDIHDKVILGGLSAVHQECVVGAMAFIGGMSRLVKDAPPFMIIEGNPSRCAGPNSLGLRRNGLDETARAQVKKMYKILWRSGLNTTQALREIETSMDNSRERDLLVSFVRKSVRGIIK